MVRVIAIDDDPLFLKVLVTYFAEMDTCELVGTYQNPVEGVKSVVRQKPDVLLLDLEMPGLDGFETLDVLDKRPKVIVISAHLDLVDVDNPLDVDRYIDKYKLKQGRALENVILSVTD